MSLLEAFFRYVVLADGDDTRGRDQAAVIVRFETEAASRRLSFQREIVLDAVGDVLLKLLVMHKTVGHPATDQEVRALIFTMLYNRAVSIWRRQSREEGQPTEEIADPAPYARADFAAAPEHLEDVRHFAARLGEHDRAGVLELLDLWQGRRSFSDVVGEIARVEGAKGPALQRIKNRKYTQHKRARTALLETIAADRSLDLWRRSLLLYFASGLGLKDR